MERGEVQDSPFSRAVSASDFNKLPREPESFAQAFSKACRVQRQRLWSPLTVFKRAAKQRRSRSARGESKNSPVSCFLRGDALQDRASPCRSPQLVCPRNYSARDNNTFCIKNEGYSARKQFTGLFAKGRIIGIVFMPSIGRHQGLCPWDPSEHCPEPREGAALDPQAFEKA